MCKIWTHESFIRNSLERLTYCKINKLVTVEAFLVCNIKLVCRKSFE